jgi:hypothetical protein
MNRPDKDWKSFSDGDLHIIKVSLELYKDDIREEGMFEVPDADDEVVIDDINSMIGSIIEERYRRKK